VKIKFSHAEFVLPPKFAGNGRMEISMKFNLSLEIEKNTNAAGRLAYNRIEGDKETGLSFWKKGRQITGTVIAVTDQVVLDLCGQKVNTSKEVLPNVVPGDEKKFEVTKVTGNIIELMLVGEDVGKGRLSAVTLMQLGKDKDNFLTLYEKKAQNSEKEKNVGHIKKNLEEVALKLTEQDYKRLEEEGFAVDKLSVEELCLELNRAKAEQVKRENPIYLIQTEASKQQIAARLAAENLPVTEEAIQKVASALNFGKAAQRIDDKVVKTLIANDSEPTIANLYKACYSGETKGQESARRLTAKAWEELKPQVEEVIAEAGYPVNEENLEEAKWLIENRLPLTKQTFAYKKELEAIKTDLTKEQLFDRIMTAMKNGTAPLEASLHSNPEFSYGKLMEEIHSISQDTLSQAVQNQEELTIKNLAFLAGETGKAGETERTRENTADNICQSAADISAKADVFEGTETFDKEDVFRRREEASGKEDISVRTDTSEGTGTGKLEVSRAGGERKEVFDEENTETEGKEIETSPEAAKKEYVIEEIKAHRQLEEIRLKMTREAAARLDKMGVSVRTEPLEKVVDALRELEDQYYRELLTAADADASEKNMQILRETTQSVLQLKQTPVSVLGATLPENRSITIQRLLTEGNHLQARYMQAGEAYETLMTVPNREYGDSIQKAFMNMGPLLSELAIEDTQANQRAVRILGYNGIEITKENIAKAKSYDLEVTTMIRNLHPAVTVRMIKEGHNPLDMPIRELNQTIIRMREEQGITSDEKFSTYLRKLEKTDGITQEERKAYIGIYRLLHQVEKSDGAALGAVLKAGQEVTLDHLLTAVRTYRKGGMDAAVNDTFGMLQKVSYKGETISDQLDYMKQMVKQVKDSLSPGKLKNIAFSSEPEIWNRMKDISMEKLFELLTQAESMPSEEKEIYTEKVKELREICENADPEIRFLNELKVPCNISNIRMANHILSNDDSPIKKLFHLKNKKNSRNSENILKETTELTDTLIDKNSMQKAYEEFEQKAQAALEQVMGEEIIDSRTLAERKNIAQQMTFLKTLAEKEFYRIPIETGHGITNMNLTIIRGAQNAGKVNVTVWSDKIGSVRAELSLKKKKLNGYISCNDREGLEALQKASGIIGQMAEEDGLVIQKLDYVLQKKDAEENIYPYSGKEEERAEAGAEAERKLYRLAKALVLTVQAAESR
jgi:hypothetical protein